MEEQKPSYNDAPDLGMDWVLQNLVKIAELGAEVGVTLTTTGGVVSGNVISGKRYLESVEKIYRDHDGPFGQMMADWARDFVPVVSDWDESGPYFIHLDNVRIELGGQLMKPQSPWRGNLAHVTGVVFGSIT